MFSFTSEKVGDSLVIKFLGEFIAPYIGDAKIQIKETFEKENLKNIVCDMSQVKLLDSSGVGLIVSLYKTSTLKGGKFAIVGMNERIKEVLEITNLLGIFKVCRDVDQALKSF